MARVDPIVDYARRRGLHHVRLVNDGHYGWILRGEGVEAKPPHWPLVWRVAEECGVSWGAGGADWHQIKPELFRVPPPTRARFVCPQCARVWNDGRTTCPH